MHNKALTCMPHTCRYNAFAAPVINTITKLLKTYESKINAPGDDQDFVVSLSDLDKMEPADVEHMTVWLERQIADVIKLTCAEVCHHKQLLVLSSTNTNKTPPGCCLWVSLQTTEPPQLSLQGM